MKRLLLSGVILLLTIAVAAMGALLWWKDRPLPLAAPSVELSIESGSTPREIARAWVDAGVQVHPMLLYEWFRWSGQATRMRAGSYEISTGVTPTTLLLKMVRGDEAQAAVRLIEGWTFRQFRAELAKAEALKSATAGMSDAEVMAALGAPGRAPAGWFFPDP